MFDGTQKNIQDVLLGDEVLGMDGEKNTVMEYDYVTVGRRHGKVRSVLGFNGSAPFTTEDHPFMTSDGWKCLDPEHALEETPGLDVSEMKVGDYLVGLGEPLIEIKSIEHHVFDEETPLYNFILDNNRSYYADGYLVHNKGSSCFVSGTQVTMADGSTKAIEKIKIGDVLQGETGDNTVIEYDRPLLGDRKLYAINGTKAFVTAEHPIKTKAGWKSFDPAATAAEEDTEAPDVTQLEIGDEILMLDGTFTKVESIDTTEGSADQELFNFDMDGDNTYYADGMLVHNKGGCFAEGTLFAVGDGTWKAVEDFKIGDKIKGGVVESVIQGASGRDWYDYHGVHVTDEHMVKDSADGVWKYVMETADGINLGNKYQIYHTLITSNCELYGINDTVFSDHNVFDYDHPTASIEDFYCDALLQWKNGDLEGARKTMQAAAEDLINKIDGELAA